MIAWPRRRSPGSSSLFSSSGGSSTPCSTPGRRARSSARRSSWRPTASRTTTTRSSRASPRAGPVHRRAAAHRHRHRAAAVLGVRAEPPGRGPGSRRATSSSGGAASLFEPTADGGFNCAGCHGGMNATGGSAPFSVTDPATGEVRAVNWNAPALNTVLYRFTPEEVQYIITYGRPGTPMSAWGLDGGGPLNAQQVETLIAYIQSIQIPRERLRRHGGRRPELPDRAPAGGDPGANRDDRPPSRRGRRVRQLRRGAVQPRPLQRRLQLRPLPHERVELRRSPGARPGRSRPEHHRRIRERPLPQQRGDDRLRHQRQRERRGLRRAGPGQRQDARIRGDAHRGADLPPSSTTCGACRCRSPRSSPSAGSRSSAASSSPSSASPC